MIDVQKTLDQVMQIVGLSSLRAMVLCAALISGIQSHAGPLQALSNVELTLFGQEAWVRGTLPAIVVAEGAALEIGIPETARLASVRARLVDPINVESFELSRMPHSTSSFLEAALGEAVHIRQGPDRASVEGVLVASSPLMVQTREGLQNAQFEDLIFPALSLNDRSSIKMTLSGDGPLEGQLQYAADGLSWKAIYDLRYFPERRRVFIEPWAQISNTTSQSFQDASLALNAGELNRIDRPLPAQPEFSRMSLAASEDLAMSERQSTGLYHQWQLRQRVDLPSRSDIKVALQAPFEAEAEVFYRIKSQVQSYRPEADSRAVTVPGFLRVTPASIEDEGAAPIAAGLARVFNVTAQDEEFFQGEDRVSTVQRGKPFEVALGQAFDIRLRRKITGFRVLGNRAREIGLDLQLENTGESDAKVILIESVGGDFTLIDASSELEVGPNQSIIGDLKILKGEKRKLAYKIRINF